MVVIKMNGEKVRMFNDPVVARIWANKHCSGNVEIVKLSECGMPRASSRIYPNEDMGNLVYKPFTNLA